MIYIPTTERVRLGQKTGLSPAQSVAAEGKRLVAAKTVALNKNVGGRAQAKHPALSPDQQARGARYVVVTPNENVKSNLPKRIREDIQ